MSRSFCAFALLIGSLVAAAPAAPPAAPKYVDDDVVYEQLFDKLEVLAKAKKPLAYKELIARRKPGRAKIELAQPGPKALTPEEVYKAALPSVFIVGSLYPDKDGNWEIGTYATAWVAAADGVLVTNWHVFEDLFDGEMFGAADHNGNVYPVTDILGGDKTADVVAFRIAAKGLTPLPVAPAPAEVGSWVGLIGHPGDLFYMYTQGNVTRYSTNRNDDGRPEKWMGLTAEYASGSSGSPVLNKYGAVVGMATLTLSLDAIDEVKRARRPAPPRDRAKRLSRADEQKEKPKPPEPAPNGSPQQMVVKMAVPGSLLLKWVGK